MDENIEQAFRDCGIEFSNQPLAIMFQSKEEVQEFVATIARIERNRILDIIEEGGWFMDYAGDFDGDASIVKLKSLIEAVDS